MQLIDLRGFFLFVVLYLTTRSYHTQLPHASLSTESKADGRFCHQFLADIGSTSASTGLDQNIRFRIFLGFCHQFLADECSTSTAKLGYYRGNGGISHLYLRDQVGGLLLSEELDRLVFLQTPCCLMQIIQAVAAFGIFTDGDGVKVEKKAPRINYVGFIAPLMTLVSSWIHA